MITIKPIVGYNMRSGRQQAAGLDGIFDDDHQLGVCQQHAGGNASLFEPISEAIEDDILKALDDRDGQVCARIIALCADDPRKRKPGERIKRQVENVH